MSVYLGSDKVGITKELGFDRLQWKCDNVKSLEYEFRNYSGESLDEVLNGLDTSQITSISYICYGCSNLLSFPAIDTSSVTSMKQAFYGCSSLEKFPDLDTHNVQDFEYAFYGVKANEAFKLDTSNATTLDTCFKLSKVLEIDINAPNVEDMGYMCENCASLTSAKFRNSNKITNLYSSFSGCGKLETLEIGSTENASSFGYMLRGCRLLTTTPELNFIKATSKSSLSGIFSDCKELVNVRVLNVKVSLQLGSGTSYGTKITLDSLINTIKELWDLTGSTSHVLTLSTASKSLISNVYVKLIDVTDEMLAQDQYVANKKPCVVCESTDEGAMLITEYVTSKNWTIA